MNLKRLKIVCSVLYRLKYRWTFLNVGENQWGLRDWYSVDDIEEKIAPTIQKLIFLMMKMKKIKILNYWVMTKWMMTMTFHQTDDQETLDDPEDEQVEDEISESDLVIEDDEDDELDEEDEDEFED